MKVITKILNKVHITNFGQKKVLGLLREGNLGAWQPGPVIGIGSPGVGVFDGEGESIVNSSHRYAWFFRDILFVSSFSSLDILDQPVVISSVGIPDNVVQHYQLLKLELK